MGLGYRRFGGIGGVIRRDLLVVLGVGTMEAQSRGHRLVTVTHVALSLLVDPDVARELEGHGVDLAELYVEIERLLPPRAAASVVLTPQDSDAAIEALVRRASEWKAGRAPAPRDVLDALLMSDHGSLRELFARHGVTAERAARVSPRRRALSAVESSRVELGPYRAPPNAKVFADADVVFWNDDKTRMELVTELLRGTFGIAEPLATALMLTVDRDGFAVVGTFERAEAERIADTATASASHGGCVAGCARRMCG